MTPDPEAEYFQTVEEFFVSRRGDPLLLSSADWLLVRRWRRAGLPLRVVLRGIGDALDAHAHSFARARKVGSLQYCAAEVEAAADRWRRALSARGDVEGEGTDWEALARALRGATLPGPRSRAAAAALAAELPDLRGQPLAHQSTWLVRSEAKLLRLIEEEGGEELRQRTQAAADAALAPYRDRMPARVVAQIRDESYARRLLEAHGLPRLSLFHLGPARGEGTHAS